MKHTCSSNGAWGARCISESCSAVPLGCTVPMVSALAADCVLIGHLLLTSSRDVEAHLQLWRRLGCRLHIDVVPCPAAELQCAVWLCLVSRLCLLLASLAGRKVQGVRSTPAAQEAPGKLAASLCRALPCHWAGQCHWALPWQQTPPWLLAVLSLLALLQPALVQVLLRALLQQGLQMVQHPRARADQTRLQRLAGPA